MENYTSDCYRSIYLSPIDFSKLSVAGMNFKIMLLIAYPKDSLDAVFVDEFNQSPEFEHLCRVATIEEIIDVLEKHNLVLYEYRLERHDIRIQSVASSEDILLETLGYNDLVNHFISVVMKSWILPNVKYSQHDIDLIQSNTLFEISTKDGTSYAVRDIKDKGELINFLIDEMTELIWSTEPFIIRHRIYYAMVTSEDEND